MVRRIGRLLRAGWTGGAARDDRVRHDARPKVSGAQDLLDSCPAHVLKRLGDGAQRRVDVLGRRGVVEAKDRYVVGDAPAALLQLVHDGSGHLITHREHCREVRILPQQVIEAGGAAVVEKRSVGDDGCVTGFRHGPFVATLTGVCDEDR